MKKIETITVVGAGTAGLVAALIIKKRFPNINVKIVRSKKIGIIGVGEGSTEHWAQFMRYLDLNFVEVISECDATFKCGIMFKNWGADDYMHSLGGDDINSYNLDFPVAFAKYISEKQPKNVMNPLDSWDNVIPASNFNVNQSPFNQYHFNTFKLNSLLEKKCKQRGINVIDDEILEVKVDEQNNISFLVGEEQEHYSDFFIDSTGFSRILMKKLGANWKSYSDCLKVKAAITFQTPQEENFNIYTLAQAKNAGWMFRIPVWDRYGNGYIYDSDFISKEQAEEEMVAHFGHSIQIGREFKFDPGALDKVWINNCCAVGLSSSFFEPLEATSIGSTIQQTFLLVNNLINYNQKIIDDYNRQISSVFDNIRDFVFLHYLGGRSDTEFWKYISTVKIPDTLQSNLEKWEHKLPTQEDFTGTSAYRMFNSMNFIQVLYGLNKFNIDSIKNEYMNMCPSFYGNANNGLIGKQNQYEFLPKITHKEYISRIRSFYAKMKESNPLY